jgi:exodeoxyribonuclease VII small subunit
MATSPPADMKFEAALAELETLVHAMEEGKMALETSIAAYQRGMLLIKHCQGQLVEAEQQIRVFEDGDLRNIDPDTLEPR